MSPWNYGLNQGPIVLMIENQRTGLIWRLMRQCPVHRRGPAPGGIRAAGYDCEPSLNVGRFHSDDQPPRLMRASPFHQRKTKNERACGQTVPARIGRMSQQPWCDQQPAAEHDIDLTQRWLPSS